MQMHLTTDMLCHAGEYSPCLRSGSKYLPVKGGIFGAPDRGLVQKKERDNMKSRIGRWLAAIADQLAMLATRRSKRTPDQSSEAMLHAFPRSARSRPL
jgi:hypothetical protein